MMRWFAFALLAGLGAMAPAYALEAGAAPITFASPAPSLDHPRKIVLSLSESDLSRVNEVIGNVGNIQKFYGADDVRIALVAYGPGLRAVLKGSPVADRIKSLVAIGVEVVACGATMESMHLGKDAVIQGVSITANGIPYIVEHQLGGWVYVRP
jgi:intracellular sulfur oxidation DsrE/DsrF family protein